MQVASRAVDDALKTLGSGKVKQPQQLLLGALLKERRTFGGAIWLRRLNGLPLPIAPAARLRKLLDELDWSAMPAEGKLRGEMADNSFKLGLSTKVGARVACVYVCSSRRFIRERARG